MCPDTLRTEPGREVESLQLYTHRELARRATLARLRASASSLTPAPSSTSSRGIAQSSPRAFATEGSHLFIITVPQSVTLYFWSKT